MNNKLKLMQIAVCLAAVSIAALAEDLETKSGNTFNNYSITGQKGSNVTVSHTGGVTVVPISDLPDRVAWPYVKSKVEDMIYDAKQAKTLDQAEHKLKEILRQYPASEELVKEELVQIQKKKEIEKQIAEILRSGTMDDQLGELRKLLEKHRENPELKQKIDYQIAVQLSTQKKLADTLARKLQEAEKELDLEKALNQLRALLKAHPNHPYSAQQQEYAERMDRLISAREAEYKKYQERRQEIRQQLQGIWQLNFTEKRTQWQSIFKSHYAVNRALTKARALQEQESYDQAIAEVEKIIRQDPRISAAAGAQDLLKTLVNQRDEIRQAQRRLAESREAVKQIRFNDSNQRAQITVRKKINEGNQWNLWIVPMELKQEIVKLQQTIDNIGNELKASKHYEALRNKSEAEGRLLMENFASAGQIANNTSNSLKYNRMFYEAKKRCNSYNIEAINTIIQLGKNKPVCWFEAKSKVCNLSNIRAAVILFAWEKFYDDSFGSTLLQSWYVEYTPTTQTVYWDLE